MHANASRGDFAANAHLLRITAIAIVIGALSTVTAYVLLHLISFFTNLFFFQSLSFDSRSPAESTLGLWVIVIPVIGGLVIGLIARYGSEAIRGHGIPEAIEAILFGKSKMSPKVAVLKPLSSAIAIGSGGPFGAEGPIIMTGGALGSLLAQYFHLTAGERKTLLVAGAVAGMTAVFGTPVAAVLLAVELLLFELRPRSLLPVAVACAVAGFTRPLLIGSGALFPLQTVALGPLGLVSCVVAGLMAGAMSWGLSSALYKVEDLFGKLPIHWMWWPALGGVVVGIGGYFEPRALGVGYDVIGDLLHNHLAISVVAGLILVKAIIWVIALGSGTSGGVLAPLLMMGAAMGTIVGPYLPGGEPALWPLVFMAATLGGFAVARLVVESVLRPNYQRAVTAAYPLSFSSKTGPPGSAWVLAENTVTASGFAVSGDSNGISLNYVPMQHICPYLTPDSAPGSAAMRQCLTQNGIHVVATFQPYDRYWLFQGIESALFIVVAIALALFSVWWVRTRIR